MLLTWPMPRSPTNGDPVITSDFPDHLKRRPPTPTPGVDIMYRNRAGAPPQRGLTNANGLFIVEPGDPAIAAAPGIVSRVDEDSPRGVTVEIDHGQLAAGRAKIKTIYRHLRLPAVRPGEGVVPGQTIGDVSFDPKDSSQTPHLHFEIEVDGRKIDPGTLLSILPVTDVGNLPPDTEGERVLRILRENLRKQTGGNFPWLLVLIGILILSSKKSKRRRRRR